jgi:CRP-like cAMP-binding protein
MADERLLDTFSSHAFLRPLSQRHLMLLASGLKPFRAAPNELFAREGTPANDFFLIQSGHVALGINTPNRGVVGILTVGPGEVVGWSWLVPPHRWQFDCRAVDAVQGLALNAEWLRDQCERDHELGYCLLKQLLIVTSSRLAATRRQLLDIFQ